ncbi:hypothetical protein GCM10014719_54070 [Planomonospora parontospora subsp. antibiotica]|nr:hypothetical protein GCM10014719_54070 [Planomonospora parontospora subsp. antibiotica]GII16225.1 hypothetical protein Ppa05_29510 [Planomonospora parontospora subsp. antibiotica]
MARRQAGHPEREARGRMRPRVIDGIPPIGGHHDPLGWWRGHPVPAVPPFTLSDHELGANVFESARARADDR